MNREQLSRVYYLTKELEMWERKMRELEAGSGIGSPVISGMPFANTNLTSDPTASEAMDLTKIKETALAVREELIHSIQEINAYIASLDDPLLRLIINYRCIETLSWNQIALKIGGGNTAKGVQMYFYRKVPKK